MQQLQDEFEDTKVVIRICTSKKDRQRNGQKKKGKRTKNDLQNITHTTNDRVTRTPLKPVVNSGAIFFETVANFSMKVSQYDIVFVTLMYDIY